MGRARPDARRKGVDGLRVASYADNLLLYLLGLVLMATWVVGAMLYRARPDSPIRFIAALVASGEWARRFARGVTDAAGANRVHACILRDQSALSRFAPYS